MKIFKVYRNGDASHDYDQSNGFVIAAENEGEARTMCGEKSYSTHQSRIGDGHYGGAVFCYECDDYWTNDSNPQVTVEVIAHDSHVTKGCVVLEDYHAG